MYLFSKIEILYNNKSQWLLKFCCLLHMRRHTYVIINKYNLEQDTFILPLKFKWLPLVFHFISQAYVQTFLLNHKIFGNIMWTHTQTFIAQLINKSQRTCFIYLHSKLSRTCLLIIIIIVVVFHIISAGRHQYTGQAYMMLLCSKFQFYFRIHIFQFKCNPYCYLVLIGVRRYIYLAS